MGRRGIVKTYDIIVIGAGDAGLGIAFKALSEGMKVALVDKGTVGGTCVNNGCVPSKTLITTADRFMEALENTKLGIRSKKIEVDYRAVMKRMKSVVAGGRTAIQKALKESSGLDLIHKEGHFIDDHTLEAGGHRIRGKRIFIATGARPSIPPIPGLDTIHYLTNKSILELERKPESMLFIGGGYIALEYAHFFSALGVKIAIVERNAALLRSGESEISKLLKDKLGRRIELHLGVEAIAVRRTVKGHGVTVKDISTGRGKTLSATAVVVSAGRTSNADLLRPERAGIKTDAANFIKVDGFLRTNKKHIWAIGDAIDRAMFTHAADKQAELAWHNATHRRKIRMDFAHVPRAVYTWPQIASVGLTEAQARKSHQVLVGRALYSDTVMGTAMVEHEGFAKAIVEKGTGRILGFHIIGPHAAMLIQEVVNAMINKAGVKSITGCMHIFPALSNIIPETFGNLE
jgi:dihydrolipoamide dehydrogenase